MPSFHQLTIMGHIGGGSQGHGPVRLLAEPGQTPMATFSVAVNTRVRKGNDWEDSVVWYNCKTWGKDAERAHQYLTKGAAVLVVGEPQKVSKFDPDTGEPRTYESVNVWRWTFAGSKRDSEQSDEIEVGDVRPDNAVDYDAEPGQPLSPGD